MNLDEYRQAYSDEGTPGWDAIDARLGEVYGEQEPKHWGTVVSYMLGGPDPIDGISAYECREGGADHLHFCTYGYTGLYFDEEDFGGDYSRHGFEMTFRLACPLPPAQDPIWVCGLLQNLARYVFDSGNYFANYHWLPTNGPIRADSDTDIVGLAFVNDPTLDSVQSPHGLVEFMQAFGLVQAELDALMSKSKTCEEIIEQHRKSNPLLITDLERKNAS